MYDCPPKLEYNSDEKVLRVTAAAGSRLADVSAVKTQQSSADALDV